MVIFLENALMDFLFEIACDLINIHIDGDGGLENYSCLLFEDALEEWVIQYMSSL